MHVDCSECQNLSHCQTVPADVQVTLRELMLKEMRFCSQLDSFVFHQICLELETVGMLSF